MRRLAISTEQSYLAWLGRYMRFLASAAEDLPRSAEGALEVLIEDHRRMSFLEAHGGTISHGKNGFRTWCPGRPENREEFPLIYTEVFPTVRASPCRCDLPMRLD